MLKQPEWVQKAFDLALASAAAEAASKMKTYDEMRICNDSLQYFEFLGYVGLVLRRDCGLIYDASAALRTLNTIANSTHGAKVWLVLSRFDITSPRELIRLAQVVNGILQDFQKIAITKNELKAASARIRTLALNLAEELAHPAVKDGLRRVRRTSAGAELYRHPQHPTVESCLSLADSALGLRNLPKQIGQPNSANAHRLFFLRELTQWIYRRTGRAMRSLVYALASVFFDMGDLSPQSLATLAPVRKQQSVEPVS